MDPLWKKIDILSLYGIHSMHTVFMFLNTNFLKVRSMNQVKTRIANSQIITLGKGHTTQSGEITHD